MGIINFFNFPNNTYFILDEKYRRELFKKCMRKLGCKNYYELSLWINRKSKKKFNGGDVKYWIEGARIDKRTGKKHPKFMPLWLGIKLIKLANDKLTILDEKVIAYRSGGRGMIINAPILPIKVTSELDSIVIHLFGDGSAGEYTPSYTQKRKEALDNFIRKLKNCFGKFQKSVYFTQGKCQVKFPKVITDIISKYYSIESYKTYRSTIPQKILNGRNKQNKLACLISFVVDEGQIRDVICLYNSNNTLLSQIRELILNCNYKCSNIKVNKKAKCYYFTLSNKSLKKFFDDSEKLRKKFPTCNFSFKENNLRFILDRRKKKNPRSKIITDKTILNVLKSGGFTATQISMLTQYAHCTITHHLKELFERKIVKREFGKDGSYVWKLY